MNLSKKHNKHIAHMLHVAWFGQHKIQSLKAWLVDENAIYYNLCEMYSNAKCHRRPTPDEFEKARAYAGLSIPPKVCTGCKEAVKRLKEGMT